MEHNEIIKALECCASGNCGKCPLKNKRSYTVCESIMAKEAFALIEQQQEHIEDLEALTTLRNKRKYYNKFVTEVYQKEKGELHYPDFDEIYRRYFEQQRMIDALIARQQSLQKHFADKTDKIVEELRECSTYAPLAKGLVCCMVIPLQSAIAIVKRGVQNDR